jgi:hypothetical protein
MRDEVDMIQQQIKFCCSAQGVDLSPAGELLAAALASPTHPARTA